MSDSVTLVPVTRQTTDGVLVDGLRKEHIECELYSAKYEIIIVILAVKYKNVIN